MTAFIDCLVKHWLIQHWQKTDDGLNIYSVRLCVFVLCYTVTELLSTESRVTSAFDESTFWQSSYHLYQSLTNLSFGILPIFGPHGMLPTLTPSSKSWHHSCPHLRYAITLIQSSIWRLTVMSCICTVIGGWHPLSKKGVVMLSACSGKIVDVLEAFCKSKCR